MKNWDIEDFGPESLLKKTIKLAKIGIYELDVASNEIYWSDVTKQITEVAEDFVPTLENLPSFFNEGHYRDIARDAMNNAITKGEPYDLDMEVVTAKGNIKCVRNVGNPKMENGVCVKLFGFLQDITERKQTKVELTKKSSSSILPNNCPKLAIGNGILWPTILFGRTTFIAYLVWKRALPSILSALSKRYIPMTEKLFVRMPKSLLTRNGFGNLCTA